MQAKALSNRQLVRAALVVIGGFLASGVLGLVRTALFSTTFGASDALDAFYAAQRIPETLFVLVAGGALGSSFIPVFSRALTADTGRAWRLASAVMTCAALVAAGIALFAALFAPQIVPALLVPDAAPAMQTLTTQLTQIMLVTVVIYSVSGLLMGILNTQGLFALPALAGSAKNIGEIFGALVVARAIAGAASDPASWSLETASAATFGLAYGAVIGACLHLAVQIPGLARLLRTNKAAHLQILPDPRVPGVRDVLTLMLPRMFGLAITQINFWINVVLTSGMIAGSRTALTTAWTLMFFALGVIGQSVGTALFPTLAALTANGDMDGFRRRLNTALRGVVALAIPATLVMIVLGEWGIGLLFGTIFGGGAWDATSTAATAWALSFFAVGVVGHALLEILARAFYALSDTRTPVAVGAAAMIANIVLSLILIRFIGDPDSLTRGTFAGLALANSLTTLVEAGVLWGLLWRRLNRTPNPATQ
ncbi:MAG: murein biosynthesis integral membrane protein MurJ [Chloroflexota bacterium]|nr:murein biosynthesis integral membrane protein MurJ [Chloroflexota bacterium]